MTVSAAAVVPLGELLIRTNQTVEVDPSIDYQEIRVRMWGKGVVQRGIVSGAQIAGVRRFVARPGQFILSRIDARHGANGLVPESLAGALVTNDFPLFDINTSRMEPAYLQWLGRTSIFVELCREASEGTTNRVRLSEERLLKFPIKLPPPEEQRRIVKQIDVLSEKIQTARALNIQSSDELAELWPSILNKAFCGRLVDRLPGDGDAKIILEQLQANHAQFTRTKANNAHPYRPILIERGPFQLPEEWCWTTLGSVVSHLIDCVNDTPEFKDTNTGFLGLKSTNVRPYHLDTSQKWYVSQDDFDRWNRRERPKAGDVILTREAPVGYACRLPENIAACLTQRLMLLRAEPTALRPELLLHYLNSRLFLDQVLEHSRGLTTPHIRVQDAPNFFVPLAPLPLQSRIVEAIDALRSSVEVVQRLQSEADAELEALLPAVLDRAFLGGL